MSPVRCHSAVRARGALLPFACLSLLLLGLGLGSPGYAEVVRVDVQERQLFADGKAFGHTGPYETIRGRLYLEVDPQSEANARIADLQLAPRNDQGRVEFWSDFFLLKPVDPLRGNRCVIYDVSNRGNKLALWTFNGGERTNDPHTAAHAGNGFLMERGYSLLWCGWNGDVVDDDTDRLLVGLPIAQKNGQPVRGKIHLEISVDEPTKSWTFGWSPWGTAAAYPTTDLAAPQATLTMRPDRSSEGTPVPRNQWAFARWDEGRAVPDPISLYVRDGLRPGWLYDVVYPAEAPRIAGLGLAAIRDCLAFFRYERADAAGTANPLAGSIETAYIFGISQSGRLINQMIYDGLTADVSGRAAFDGALIHVAGAGRGLFNHRFGLATLYATQHRDNLVPSEEFPMAPAATTDPDTGCSGNLLSRAQATGHVPKIFYVQTSTEYWSRGASLLHTDVDGKRDVEIDPNVRIYFVAGAQHLGGGPPTRGISQNPRNILDDRPPILRALLVAMDRWVRLDRSPPESRYPRIDDGTLVSVETFRETFPKIPGVSTPAAAYAPLRLDFGPRWEDQGIADIVPPNTGARFRTLVPVVDADGNELAGIRLPDVAVPLGTFTGWNLRAAPHGAEEMLSGLDGSYLAFASDAQQRQQQGDPRPSIVERYPTREIYLAKILEATLQLEQERFLLPADATHILRTAAARDHWD